MQVVLECFTRVTTERPREALISAFPRRFRRHVYCQLSLERILNVGEIHMARSSNFLFARTIDGKPVMISEEYVVPSPTRKPKRASKLILTTLIVIIGIGAGWIGGKVLNGRLGVAPAAAPPIDAAIEPASPTNSQAHESATPAKRDSDGENHAASRSKADRDDEEPVVAVEPPPKTAASREAPPKVPRVEKEEEADATAGEDPSKEIGRSALKKIKKEMKKAKKGDPDNEDDRN